MTMVDVKKPIHIQTRKIKLHAKKVRGGTRWNRESVDGSNYRMGEEDLAPGTGRQQNTLTG